MCQSSVYSAKNKTIGMSRLPCRAEDDGQTIEVNGLILRVGDRYGAPIMAVKDPYAPDPKPKTRTCGGFTQASRPACDKPSGSEE